MKSAKQPAAIWRAAAGRDCVEPLRSLPDGRSAILGDEQQGSKTNKASSPLRRAVCFSKKGGANAPLFLFLVATAPFCAVGNLLIPTRTSSCGAPAPPFLRMSSRVSAGLTDAARR